MQRLIRKGCDPNAINSNGEAALHGAVMRGKLTVVSFLLYPSNGFNVDINLRVKYV